MSSISIRTSCWAVASTQKNGSYVDTVLRFFRKRDGFASFSDSAMKDYVHFKGALIDFRMFYGLEEYNLKQLDKYLWLLGKDYFPKNYGKKG